MESGPARRRLLLLSIRLEPHGKSDSWLRLANTKGKYYFGDAMAIDDQRNVGGDTNGLPALWHIGQSRPHVLPLTPPTTAGFVTAMDAQGDAIGDEGGPSDPVSPSVVWPAKSPPVVLHSGLGPINSLGGVARSASNPNELFVAGAIIDKTTKAYRQGIFGYRAALWSITLSTTGGPPVKHFFGDLGVLPGDSSSWAYGVNSAGSVVGNSWQDNRPGHAVVFARSGVITNLTAMVPASLQWQVQTASAINNRGEVVVGEYVFKPVPPAR